MVILFWLPLVIACFAGLLRGCLRVRYPLGWLLGYFCFFCFVYRVLGFGFDVFCVFCEFGI